jgi:lysozyme
MKRSQKADLFVKGFEKLVLRSYLPTPDDVPTIGWGQTGPRIRMGMTWSKAEADAAYDEHANGLDLQLSKAVYGVPTTQGQFDALFSFAYNAGLPALKSSTLFRLHKAGKYAEAAAQFARWVYQGKKKLRGLVRRRQGERALYLS